MTSARSNLGVAIIGSGMISEFQSKAIGELPNARVVGFFDQVAKLAEKRAAQFDARAYATIDELLGDSEVDIVSVCTPSGAHLDPAVAAAGAGKHVMVEKPVEVTTERVDRIVAACRRSGVKLGAIFPRRFMDSSAVVKAAVDRGRFGVVSLADVYIKWYRSQEYYDSGGWRGTWKLDGGGALMNQGIHGIDLIQWLMGGIDQVSGMIATRSHERIEVEDVATASVRYANGSLGVIEGTTGAWPGQTLRIEISGSRGHVVMEDETLVDWTFADEDAEDAAIRAKFGPERRASGGASDPKAISHEGHRRQFEDFVGAIQRGETPRCDGNEGRAAVAIITGIYQSAREGRAIDID